MKSYRIRITDDVMKRIDSLIDIEKQRNHKEYNANGIIAEAIDQYMEQKNYTLIVSQNTLDQFDKLKGSGWVKNNIEARRK